MKMVGREFMGWRQGVLLGLALGLLAGCAVKESKAPAPPDSPATVTVLSEHRFQATTNQGAPLGHDCSAGGTNDCASGLCVHVGAQRNAGYICTVPCNSSIPCPEGWRCGQVHPTDPSARICLPRVDAQ